jgi:phospholipid-binding lipoprotein MlaA
MLKSRYAAIAGLAAVFGLSGCVTLPPGSVRSPQDPWESWNRGVYKVNDKLDHAVARPVARTYVRAVPAPARTGVSNFFSNLRTPRDMINDALQGKFLAAGNDLARFLLNTTVGVGGLLDPATAVGLDHNNEDFGQTLGVWGVHPGPFLELPLLGPSDLRDGPARIVDAYTNPETYIAAWDIKIPVYALDLVDVRTSLLSLDDTLKNVFDPYAFIRDAYLQRRAYLVSDGKVPDEAPLVDPGEDTQAPVPAPTTPAAPPPPAPAPAAPPPTAAATPAPPL